MTTATRTRITAEEFLKMDLGEGIHELVRGEIITLSPPEYWHGLVCLNIGSILHDFGRRTGHGHIGSNDSTVGISDDTVRGADLCYYSEARWPRSRAEQERPPVPPDLTVEVLSPGDRPGKVFEKLADYLAAGVLMVWIVDPRRRTLSIYRRDDATPTVLGESDHVADLPELPGFRGQVAEFFA